MAQQIDLLFGVSRGGEVGDSAVNIQRQLDEIAKQLTININKIKINPVALNSLSEQITGNISAALGKVSIATTAKTPTPAASTKETAATFEAVATKTAEAAHNIGEISSATDRVKESLTVVGDDVVRTSEVLKNNILESVTNAGKLTKYGFVQTQTLTFDYSKVNAVYQLYNKLQAKQAEFATNGTFKDTIASQVDSVTQYKDLVNGLVTDLEKFKTADGQWLPGSSLTKEQIADLERIGAKYKEIDRARALALQDTKAYNAQVQKDNAAMERSQRESATASKKAVNEYKAAMNQVAKMQADFSGHGIFNLSDFAKSGSGALDSDTLKQLEQYQVELTAVQEKLIEFKNQNADAFNTGNFNENQINEFNRLKQSLDDVTVKYHNVKDAVSQYMLAASDTSNAQRMLDKLAASQAKFQKNFYRAPKIENQYVELAKEIEGLMGKYKDQPLPYQSISNIKGKLADIEKQAYASGLQIDKFGDKLRRAFSERLRFMATTYIFSLVTMGLRDIYRNVVDIDTAMTELRKVADETDAAYSSFLSNASDRAKNLGATLKEVINATADYARLGFNLDDASTLADTALIYKNVGDDVNDIDTATEHLIATMKGFGLEASDAMRIVDVFNEVSNNFAVSAGDIGEGLQRSSAAMAAAGNSLEQTVAIFTAADTIQQNAEVTGTALKTMSARLRGSKSELEDLGEDTEGLASSTSKLRGEIKKLTGVDIMLDDNNFKSTYDILQDLSEVWDDLTDVSRANVLEQLFGKRQASIGAGLLENFDIAAEAYDKAMNSAGSATKENAIYLESIQGHLDKLEATWEAFTSHLLDTKFVKAVIDALTELVDILDSVVESFGDFGAVMELAAIPLVAFAPQIITFVKSIGIMVEGLKKAAAIGKATSEVLAGAEAIASGAVIRSAAEVKAAKLAKVWLKVKTAIEAAGVAASVTFAVVGAALTALLGAGIAFSVASNPEKMTEGLEKVKAEYDDAKKSIDNTNSAIAKNEEAIKERQEIIASGKGTIVDETEIANLQAENDLLKTQLEYETAIAEQKKSAQLEEIKKRYNTDGNIWNWGEVRGYTGKINPATDKSYTSTGVSYVDSLENLQKGIEYYQDRILQYEADPENNKWMAGWIDNYEKYISNLKVQYAEVKKNLVETRNLIVSSGAEDPELQQLLKEINEALSKDPDFKADQFKEILSNTEFAEILDAIRSFGDKDIVWKDLEGLGFDTELLQVFESTLEATGYSLDEFADKLRETAVESENEEISMVVNTTAIDGAKTATEELAKSFKTLSDAFKEQSENGSLSVDTILGIIDAGYAAALVVDQETGKVRIDSQAYIALAQAKIAEQIVSLQAAKAEAQHTLALQQEAISAHNASVSLADLANTKAAIASIDAQLAVLSQIDLTNVVQGLYDVGSAANSAKSALSSLQSGMNTLLDQTIAMLKKEEDASAKAVQQSIDNQVDALEEAKDAAKDRWDAEKDALNEALDAYDKIIDAQIEALKREKEADDYERNKSEKAKAVSDIENQLAALANDDSIEAQKLRLELQSQLVDAQNELNELQTDREYDLREQALSDERDRFKDETQAKIDAIEAQAEAEQEAYEKRIEALRDYAQSVKDEIDDESRYRLEAYDLIQNHTEELYARLLDYNYKYGDGLTATVDDWFAKSKGWQKYGSTFYEALENITRMLNNMEDSAGGVVRATEQATSQALSEIAKLLTDWHAKLLEAGNQAGADLVSSLLESLNNAAQLGYEISDELVAGIRNISEQGDIEMASFVKNAVDELNLLKASGADDADEMLQQFAAFLSTMTTDSKWAMDLMLAAIKTGNKNIFDSITRMVAANQSGLDSLTQSLLEMRNKVPTDVFDRMWAVYITGMKNADQATFAYGQNMLNNLQILANAFQDVDRLAEQKGLTNQKSKEDYAEFKRKQVYGQVFASGGVAAYTGPAHVDGTPTNPEVVFNAAAASKLYNYVMNTPDLVGDMVRRAAVGGTNSNVSMGGISITINGNADSNTVLELKKAASAIQDNVVKKLNESLSRRGLIRSPRTI